MTFEESIGQPNAFDSYQSASRQLLAKADQEISEGDLLQASEKLWGAAAHMVKAVAQNRGWEHSSHRALYQVISRLVGETGDGELRDLFLIASQLHANFYEGWLLPEDVEAEQPRVRELVRRLEALV